MDAQTTAYIFILLGMLLNASALGVSWHLSRPMAGAGAWFLGATINFASFVPLLVNLFYPWQLLVSLHNACVTIGQAIVVAGVYWYFGKKPAWPIMVGIITGFLVIHSWYLYVDYDVSARTVVASVAIAALNGMGAWRLTTEPWTGGRVARTYAVVGWWSLTLVLVLRALLVALHIGVNSSGAPTFETNIAYLLAFIVAPATATATLLGLIMMTVRRLADERELALLESRRTAEHFEQLASYDSLTQAYNRRMFMIRANEELSQCRRNGQAFSLLSIDLDHFKQINDTYGHAGGDEALRYVSRCVRTALRDFDAFGRIGGEEFAIALSGVNQEQAIVISNRLREIVADGTIEHEGKSFSVTLSGGVTTASESDSLESMFQSADVALYEAKNSGRNRIEAAPQQAL